MRRKKVYCSKCHFVHPFCNHVVSKLFTICAHYFIRYQALIHIPPPLTSSYTNTVTGAKSIISTAANLESQTLLFAYGGSDLFFTRFAPSKSFDSLPESFNKFVLVMVLLGMFFFLNKLDSMSKKKLVQLGWA